MYEAIVFLPLIGAILAGLIALGGARARHPGGSIPAEWARKNAGMSAGPGAATVWGQNFKTSAHDAALVNGVGVAQVAELLGHTDTEMVSKVYGHLAGEVAHMRQAAIQAASRA